MSLESDMRRAVVLLSGGLDSATTLALAREQGFSCYCLSVDYGQRHAAELEAARRVALAGGAHEHRVMRVDLAGIGGSALTDPAIAVPEQPTTGIPVTYVPARNTIMLSLALAWAEVLEAPAVFIGVNAVDYSVSGDTRVWIRRREGARLMPIAEVHALPAWESCETLAVDTVSLQVDWRRVRGREKHCVSGKRCFRVRLERGQQIDITEDHSLFTISGAGSISAVCGDEIVLGMPLVAPFDLSPQVSEWSRELETIELARSSSSQAARRSSVVEIDGFLTNRLRHTKVPVQFPVNDDFLRIVGLWLAEGGKEEGVKSRTLAFSIGGLEGAADLLRRYFAPYVVSVHKSPLNDFDYAVASSVFCEVFTRLDLLGTAKSGRKHFPAWFWSLSQRQRRVMVAGLWDGDGAHVWSAEAPIYQKSHDLIDGLYHCLLLDGIFPTVKPANHHGHKRLALTRASDFARFVELYPLWHKGKRESLRAAAAVAGRDKATGLWKCGALWDTVSAADLTGGMKTRIYNSGGKYDAGVHAQRSAFAGIPSLDRVRESKLAFLRVVAIEPISCQYMYDLSVEHAENFIANGFLAHNSGYPDCRPEFIAAFEQLAAHATKSGVEGNACRVHTPLIAMTKAQIILAGTRLRVDYAQTVSCYQADATGSACGRCDACRLRRAGFEAAGVPDPTRYQAL
jgi:7-cyano-7-deazaguanine synthase in queuosine biosynthesis/intein/homing endonuclease